MKTKQQQKYKKKQMMGTKGGGKGVWFTGVLKWFIGVLKQFTGVLK